MNNIVHNVELDIIASNNGNYNASARLCDHYYFVVKDDILYNKYYKICCDNNPGESFLSHLK